MIDEKDGGPAFPDPPIANDAGVFSNPNPGMSLRDYFASKALSGISSSPDIKEIFRLCGFYSRPITNWNVARCAYTLADAMLRARSE